MTGDHCTPPEHQYKRFVREHPTNGRKQDAMVCITCDAVHPVYGWKNITGSLAPRVPVTWPRDRR